MTSNRKIQKADVIQAALTLLEEHSLDDLTVRRLATALDCSVQPIFYNFENMDEVKAVALQSIHELYQSYMLEGAKCPRPYQGMGFAYIRFARDYPNYFKLLFMTKTDLTPETFIDQSDVSDEIIRHGMAMTGFNEAAQRAFHLKVWIFTHGLATLVASGTVQFSDADIERLLTETVQEIATSVREKLTGGGRYHVATASNR